MICSADYLNLQICKKALSVVYYDGNLCEKPDEWQFQRFAGPDRNAGKMMVRNLPKRSAQTPLPKGQRESRRQTDLRLSMSIQLPLQQITQLVSAS